jgi:hypothetical protein
MVGATGPASEAVRRRRFNNSATTQSPPTDMTLANYDANGNDGHQSRCGGEVQVNTE